jgi:WhiB family redox-sensing transcriptional regulator
MSVALSWRDHANCRGADPEQFYASGAPSSETLDFCRRCKVRSACLDFALSVEDTVSRWGRFGVYGGLTAAERARVANGRFDAHNAALERAAAERDRDGFAAARAMTLSEARGLLGSRRISLAQYRAIRREVREW